MLTIDGELVRARVARELRASIDELAKRGEATQALTRLACQAS